MKKRFVVGFNLPCKVTVIADSVEAATREVIEKGIDGDLYNVEEGSPEFVHVISEQSEEEAKREDAESRALSNAIDKGGKLQRELGLWAIWSMYEVIDKMDEVPFPGAEKMYYEVDDYWGTSVSGIIKPDSTWKDLWVAASNLMKLSGDGHHQFIESMECRDGIVHITTGS